MSTRKDLPNPNAPNFLQRVREEIHALLGKTGSARDRALTLDDAINSGVIGVGPGGSLIPGPATGETYEPDLTPPPTPTGFAVDAAISHVFIEHDPPLYRQGHGHLRTRVYGVTHTAGDPLPVFADAVEVGQFEGTVWALPSNPATTWHLWIKWETRDGVLSASPAGGTNGLSATTGQDVSSLLDALAGQIGDSQLANDLATPIGQIPSISSTASEALSKANANIASIQTLQADLAALSGTADYDGAGTYGVGDIVKYSGGLYRAIATTTGNLPTNAAYWEKIGDYASLGDAVAAHSAQLSDHETRIDNTESGLAAEASDRETLATQLRGTYTGSNVASVTSGLIYSERKARSEADAAEVTARQDLSAKLTGSNNPSSLTLETLTSGLLFDERQARVSAVSAQALRIDGLESVVNNPTTGVEATASALDAVETLVNNSTTGVTATANKTALLESRLQTAGGENQLFNPSFEVEGATPGLAKGWFTRGGSGAPTPVRSLVTSFLGNTDKAQRLEYTGLSTWAGIQQESAYRFGVIDTDKLSFSCSFRATPGWTIIIVTSYWNSSGSSLGEQASPAVTATGLPQRVVHDGATPYVGTVRVAFELRVSNTNGITSGFVEWDRAQAEIGLVATGWRDSNRLLASDVVTKASQTALNDLSTRVDATEDSITLQGQAITALQGSLEVFENGLTTKADASALETTNTNVSNLGDSFTALSSQTNTLQAQVASTQGERLYKNFEGGVDLWTHSRTGLPGSVSAASGTLVTDDPDFGACGRFTNFTTAGASIGPKEWMPVRPGRVYRLRCRFKIETMATAGSMSFNTVVGCHNAAGAVVGDGSAFSTNNSGTLTSTGVYQIESLFSDTASTGVAPFDAGTVLARPMLRLNTAGTGSVIRVQFLEFVDITEERDLTASVQTEATTRASETGELFAKYTVKVDVAGHVSGYGLASTANNGAVVSQFGIRADQFFVAPPATSSATAPTTNLYKGRVWVDTSVTPNVTRYYTGSAWSTTPQALPFVVQTTPTTINGETVPPGVYIDNAYMARLVATRGQIGLLAVDDARIANLSVSKLTTGSIAVGQYAQSTGYVAGSSGWRINGDGTAEFSGVVVRGTIFASQGAIGGWTIGSSYLQSTTYALGTSGTRFNSNGTGQLSGITIGADYIQTFGFTAGTSGWRLSADGTLELNSGTFRGNIDLVGDGKFSVKTATSGARMEMSSRVIKVFDASGVLRVQIGDLTV